MRKNSKKAATEAATEAATVNPPALQESPATFVKETERLFYKAEPEKEILSEIGKAVSLSYRNPATATARKKRRGCFASQEGEIAIYYDSVEKAFRALIPSASDGAIIKFRGKLRASEGNVLYFPIKDEKGETIKRFIFSDTLPPKERRLIEEGKAQD